MTAVFINKQGLMDHTYIGNLYTDAIVVYARSLPQAKQRAVEHFKPKKKDIEHLAVDLYCVNAEQYNIVEFAGNA